MPKVDIDYSLLEKKKTYKYADVKHKLVSLGFDMYKFRDSDDEDISKLWQIQSADDGEFIISTYDNSILEKKTSLDWEVLIKNSSVHFFYKGEPITKLATKNLGIPEGELYLLPNYLPKKLQENKTLLKSLIAGLSENARKSLSVKYPELFSL